ncbi:MAG: tetratricopeptide repeat protein [Nostocaceae cyanobacterium]|nr:tetratricopeptide repeat protein [Nostocaceae cyanobacterium]
MNNQLLNSSHNHNQRYTGVLPARGKVQQHPAAKGKASPVLPDKYVRSCALAKARDGDYTEAIALLSQLIYRSPDNAIDYNNRGLMYFENGESDKALSDYNTALQINPNLASAYNNRANYYAASGELAAAIADYDQALDLNPSHVRAWINRGITLRDLQRYEQAIDNFDMALFWGQLEGHIYAERGRTYHLCGDWNCAIADYQRALTELPQQILQLADPAWRLRLQVETWLFDLLSSSV